MDLDELLAADKERRETIREDRLYQEDSPKKCIWNSKTDATSSVNSPRGRTMWDEILWELAENSVGTSGVI